jgi:hypothetical protein
LVINNGDFKRNKKTKVNRFGEAMSQKKKRQGTAVTGLSAYETIPYAFHQIPQRQTRVSRKMRVKTPVATSSKNPRRSGSNIQMVSGSGDKKIRPTTAVGVSKVESNDFNPNKGRRFLASAKPGNRRQIGSKKIINAFERNTEEEFGDGPPNRVKEHSLALGIDSDYGDDDEEDNPSNKMSTEITLTAGIPVPSKEFSMKYTPAQGKRGVGLDLRPSSRHKTPTKFTGFDGRPKSPHLDARRETLNHDENDEFASHEYKSHEKRRKNHTSKATRANVNKVTNFLENGFQGEAEIPFTITTTKTNKERSKINNETDLIQE